MGPPVRANWLPSAAETVQYQLVGQIQVVIGQQNDRVPMAGHVDKLTPDETLADMKAQQRLRERVTRRFGWKPQSIRFLPGGCTLWEVALVKVKVPQCPALMASITPQPAPG